jgi:hypothetical protein
MAIKKAHAESDKENGGEGDVSGKADILGDEDDADVIF